MPCFVLFTLNHPASGILLNLIFATGTGNGYSTLVPEPEPEPELESAPFDNKTVFCSHEFGFLTKKQKPNYF